MNRRTETSEDQDKRPLSTGDIAAGRNNNETAVVDGTPEGSLREGMMSHPTGEQAPLMTEDHLESYSERWQVIQGRFVDEPKGAVEEADGLVAEVIQDLASTFAEQRKGLESKWQTGSEASTDELLLALRQYKSFFQRLLAA